MPRPSARQPTNARAELADFRRVDPDDAAMLDERADIVDRATDIVEQMVDDVVAVEPTDEKGRAIVPDWEADYRTYLQNRRDFADELRGGENVPFREAAYRRRPDQRTDRDVRRRQRDGVLRTAEGLCPS